MVYYLLFMKIYFLSKLFIMLHFRNAYNFSCYIFQIHFIQKYLNGGCISHMNPNYSNFNSFEQRFFYFLLNQYYGLHFYIYLFQIWNYYQKYYSWLHFLKVTFILILLFIIFNYFFKIVYLIIILLYFLLYFFRILINFSV